MGDGQDEKRSEGDRGERRKRLPASVLAWWAVLLGALAFFLVFDVEVRPRERVLSLAGKQTAKLDATSATIGEDLAQTVAPEEGYTVDVNWGDTGVRLVEAGGIDMGKYRENYGDEKYQELLAYLTEPQNKGITITQDNAYFWVNTLWALGLTQKSDVLDKGVMGVEYKDKLGNFASTGGWTLGAADAVSLYSSSAIVPLTEEQQALVAKVSNGIYRPCCGNPTSFPDCNHGMAILGLLELMASQGSSEEEMYRAALAFNSYWFTQTYVDLAYYFMTEKKTQWEDVDAKEILAAQYSSAAGYQSIKEKIGNVPGMAGSGGACGA